uniref:Eyes absent homolog n=1 Tax=Lepisosteus oculatus TaxID=7918 RepID=W5M9M0_LEPOC|nr:PREDICTED: eyes absent homolog 3 isoform X2 [Lepisosteus oculatus]XP_015204071.1 PREDICTED: eyes absent homolog 3 isoform X2 [Lepisosteus oculatus]
MDESQELTELPAKKARHELKDSEEKGPRVEGMAENDSQLGGGESAVLKTDSDTYTLSGETQLGEVKREQSGPGSESCEPMGGDPLTTYRETAVTCADLNTKTSNEYTSQMYQTSKPYTHILSPAITSYSTQSQFPAVAQSTIYTAYPQGSQNYGLPPFGAMWPGIKSESGLSEVPPVGQPSFLSFSTGYTSTPPGQAHYSYPSQASSFTTSSVYTNIPSGTAATTATATVTNQEYPNYTPLGQSQYPQYYAAPSYVSAGMPNNSGGTESVNVAGYPSMKTDSPATADLLTATDSAAGVPASTGSRDHEEAGRRNSTGKAKSKGKKSDTSQPANNDLERVFLWDLDETIIIFHSLLTGSFAQKFGKDPTTALTLGLQMEELIFELADTHLFFNDLEECDQVHVEDVASDDNGQDLSSYNFATDGFSSSGSSRGPGSASGVQGGVEWMRKLAFRYRRLKEIYNTYKSNIGTLLSPLKKDLLGRLQSDVETVTDSWLSTAMKSLLLIQARGKCVNVLVTTTQLVPALAKVLLYGLGEVFPVENIYSATKIGKESCFERIVSRFGKKVTYVVIGDGRDEEFAAKQHNMPFWRISNHGDLVSLHQALELDFL